MEILQNNKTIIIAEAGVNHNGDIRIAKELIRKASNIGADIIKFQTFKADQLVTEQAEMANYQKRNSKNDDTTQHKMLTNLELSREEHLQLIQYE